MILEVAQIDVKPGMETEFEKRLAQAIPLLQRAKGFRTANVHRSIERPSRYRLFVEWETVENHVVDFQGSSDFQEWRRLVSPCFERLPEVEHSTETLRVSPP